MPALAAITQSPLIGFTLAPVLFLALVAIGRWLKRRHGVRLGFPYLLFSLVASLYLPLLLFGPALIPEPPTGAPAASASAPSPKLESLQKQLIGLEEALKTAREELSRAQPPQPAPVEKRGISRELLVRHLGAALAILGSFVVLALIRRFFWQLWFERKYQLPAPKFLSQILGLFLFVSTAMLILSTVYQKDLTAFVFGSTVVVGIIGFAMQDLLGNIIAGIALEVGKPFKVGDWLLIDGQRAEVSEVNWRSTRIRTNDDIFLDIPNKSISGSSITNLTNPNRPHGVRIRVGFEYGVPPNRVKDCVKRAVTHAAGVLPTPPPKVFLQDFGDSAIIYEIKFWLENEGQFNDICDAVRTNIWYEAERSDIRIPFPIRTVKLERSQPRKEPAMEQAMACVRQQPVLQCLDSLQTQKLLMRAKLQRFGRGEKVIEQGEEGASMFILLTGQADVFVNAHGHDTFVATLRPGDYFGEMSLLTGERRSASVVARGECEMWEIEKEVMAEILQVNSELVQKFSELLAKRRMELEGILSTSEENRTLDTKQKEYTAGFLAKLCSFFDL